ncbi:MAG: D-3-phosphoglycerate dehydrogenase, partial [uncultured Thermomicrobiales bacterium]
DHRPPARAPRLQPTRLRGVFPPRRSGTPRRPRHLAMAPNGGRAALRGQPRPLSAGRPARARRRRRRDRGLPRLTPDRRGNPRGRAAPADRRGAGGGSLRGADRPRRGLGARHPHGRHDARLVVPGRGVGAGADPDLLAERGRALPTDHPAPGVPQPPGGVAPLALAREEGRADRRRAHRAPADRVPGPLRVRHPRPRPLPAEGRHGGAGLPAHLARLRPGGVGRGRLPRAADARDTPADRPARARSAAPRCRLRQRLARGDRRSRRADRAAATGRHRRGPRRLRPRADPRRQPDQGPPQCLPQPAHRGVEPGAGELLRADGGRAGTGTPRPRDPLRPDAAHARQPYRR